MLNNNNKTSKNMDNKRFINPVAGTTREFKTETIEDTISNILKDERISLAGTTITTKEEVIDDAENR